MGKMISSILLYRLGAVSKLFLKSDVFLPSGSWQVRQEYYPAGNVRVSRFIELLVVFNGSNVEDSFGLGSEF